MRTIQAQAKIVSPDSCSPARFCKLTEPFRARVSRVAHAVLQAFTDLYNSVLHSWNLLTARSPNVRPLSPARASELLDFAWMSKGIHRNRQSWFHNHEVIDLNCALPSWAEKRDGVIFKGSSGLKAMVACKRESKQLVICLGAHNSGESFAPEHNWKWKLGQKFAGWTSFFGTKPQLFEDAACLASHIKHAPEYSDHSITLMGHCLGGSLASYAALQNELPAICFNSLPIGAGLQRAIGMKKLSHADLLIEHIAIDGDYMSDNRLFRLIHKVCAALSLAAPQNFGRVWRVPSAFQDAHKTHCVLVPSLEKHAHKLRCLQ